jgi:hypothetical protein
MSSGHRIPYFGMLHGARRDFGLLVGLLALLVAAESGGGNTNTVKTDRSSR